MEDEEIVSLFFQRSESAIDELDRKYGRLCHKIASNILSDSHDAEECVNDAYLGVWNTVPPKKPDPLSAFICKIVRNISLARYHRNTALKRNSFYDTSLSEIEEIIPSLHTAEAQAERTLLTQAIESFLDTLEKENRVIFVRRYFFGDSYEEIASQVSLTVKNVSVRLTRMRKKLREYLSEQEVI